jgi:hypothetical protein
MAGLIGLGLERSEPLRLGCELALAILRKRYVALAGHADGVDVGAAVALVVLTGGSGVVALHGRTGHAHPGERQ